MKTNSNPTEINHVKKCLVCETKLTGRQTKYCSRQCLNQSVNKKHKDYEVQQKRGLSRKIELVNMLGGKCEKCNYKDNYAALSFHHIDPKQKSFPLDLRHCSNRSWDKLVTESQKCQLLCIRCHYELHNPDLFI